MPSFSTPSGTTQPWIPAIERAQANRVPGTNKGFSGPSEMQAAVAQERVNIGMGLPVWFHNERIHVALEPAGVDRHWTLSTAAGSAAANAAASHARRFTVFSREFTLASDTNRVLTTVGEPSGGDNGDFAVDDAAGVVYSRGLGGVWSEVHRVGGGAAAAITVGTGPPDNDDGLPDDSIYIQVAA